MLVALCYFLLLLGVGRLLTWRTLGLQPVEQLAIAPGVGLTAVAGAGVWLYAIGAPPGLLTALLLMGGGAGNVILVRDLRRVWWPGRWENCQPGPPAAGTSLRLRRIQVAALGGATVTPLLVLAATFGNSPVPTWNFDGAFHVEVVQQLREGRYVETWYPLGFHTGVAALLALVPWLDSARGAYEASWGLAGVAALTGFGFARALSGSSSLGALTAVLMALTYAFPYKPHIWSNWPSAAGVVLSLTSWSLAILYLRAPSRRLAVLTGIVAAAHLLVHGVDIYPTGLGLIIILAAQARLGPLGRSRTTPSRHLLLAGVVAVAVAGPYWPTLLGWASQGGAVSAGTFDAARPEYGMARDLLAEMGWWAETRTFASGPIDGLARTALLAAGIYYLARGQRGRWLLVLTAVFGTLIIAAGRLEVPLFAWIFAYTYPWFLPERLVYIPSVLLNIVEAAGILHLIALLQRQRGSRRPRSWIVPVAAGSAALSAWAAFIFLYVGLRVWADTVATYTPDDAAAMAWLGTQAAPGEVVVNDGAADAGIWAPYKAGTPILFPRSLPWSEGAQRDQVMPNLLSLGEVLPARAQACAAGVRYLYHGARVAFYAPRMLPSLAELRASAEWEEVFASGQAVIFRWRVECP